MTSEGHGGSGFRDAEARISFGGGKDGMGGRTTDMLKGQSDLQVGKGGLDLRLP